VPDRHITLPSPSPPSHTTKPAVVRQRIERKLRSLRGEISDKKFASIYRSLLAAGFPSDLIRRELKSFTREELPATDSESEE